jgi:hypothetical protein
MTPKQQVLKQWPGAVLTRRICLTSGRFRDHVIAVFGKTHSPKRLGNGPTPAAAWRNAARNLK